MAQEKVLRAVQPNAGIEAAYASRLLKLVDAMHKSIMYWIVAAYRRNPPDTRLAMDDSTAIELDKIMRRLTRYWQTKFREAGTDIAKYFADKTTRLADNSLEQILKESGFAVPFELKFTPAMNDVFQATVKENVSLITNMSQKHLNEIYGMVMRSVQMGGDLGTLTKSLEAKYKMTRRRARLISRDQNSKATAAITRTRQAELGIKQAKWLHSHAGKTPRPTHVAMNGKPYDVGAGMWDPDADGKGKGRYVYPGELINCRCVSRPIISIFQ